MKRFIKIALIVVSVVGGLYLIASQFIFIGTSDEDIAYYNFKGNFEKGLDTLSLNWSEQNMDQLNDLYFQLEVVDAMGALDKDEVSSYVTDVNSMAETVLKSYFTRNTWLQTEMKRIKSLAEYINYQYAINAVDGYHSIQSIIYNSQLCKTQKQVEASIADAQKYTVAPWTYCTELKEGLGKVPQNACSSYTNRTLVPKCNKMQNFRSSYQYFDDFDADYQMVKNAKSFLAQKQYQDANLNSKFASIKYNDAANQLDPKFF
jgi:hypothetical protein